MRRSLLLLLLLALSAVACNNNNSKSTNLIITSSNDSSKQNTSPVKPWYKRFTGVIAGREVVVNLNLTGRNDLRGTYSYNRMCILLELNSENVACSNNQFYLNETEPTNPAENNRFEKCAHWFVTLDGDKLTGKWVSRDEAKNCDIDLKEDYSNGAIRFGLFSNNDSISVKHGKAEVTAKKSYLWPEPGEYSKNENSLFIVSVLVRIISSNEDSIPQSIRSLIEDGNTDFFEEFKNETDKEGNIEPEAARMYSQENENKIWVDYNQGGFVVFESYSYDYMGGAHGIYGSTFTCADLQEKRIWKMNDILKIDTLKLDPPKTKKCS